MATGRMLSHLLAILLVGYGGMLDLKIWGILRWTLPNRIGEKYNDVLVPEDEPRSLENKWLLAEAAAATTLESRDVFAIRHIESPLSSGLDVECTVAASSVRCIVEPIHRNRRDSLFTSLSERATSLEIRRSLLTMTGVVPDDGVGSIFVAVDVATVSTLAE